jgi:O-antigen/teichoic acid export membrane protein
MTALKRNLGWLLISQAATWSVSIVLLIVAPEKLGDKAFGQLAFALVYVGFFELFALFGVEKFLVKTVARKPDEVGRYVFNVLVEKAVTAAGLALLAIGLAIALGIDGETTLLIGAYAIGMFLNSLNAGLVGGLQGLQKMARPALWEVLRSYVGGVIGLTILLLGGPLLAYALVFNLVGLIPVLGNFTNLWPHIRKSRFIDFAIWREVFVGGFPFFILAGLLAFYGTIDIPILHAMSGNRTVGWYAVAYRWVSMPAFLAASVATAFFPALSANSVGNPQTFARMANRALQLVILFAVPAAVGIALVAHPFLDLLYGDQFKNAAPLMQLLALHIPIVGFDIILGTAAVAADRQREWVMFSVLAAIFNPLANLIAIPVTEHLFQNGAIGASVITVGTEVILMIGAISLRPVGVLDAPTVRTLLRIVVAGLAMIPVAIVLEGKPLAVIIVACAVVYGLASFALKTISISELRHWGSDDMSRTSPQTTVTG